MQTDIAVALSGPCTFRAFPSLCSIPDPLLGSLPMGTGLWIRVGVALGFPCELFSQAREDLQV